MSLHLPYLYAASVSACLAELGVTRLRAPPGELSLGQVLVALSGAQLLALLLAFELACLVAFVRVSLESFRRSGLLDPQKRLKVEDLAPAALVMVAPSVGLAALGVFVTMRAFSNQELAAIVAALLATACVFLGALGTAHLALGFRAARDRRLALGTRRALATWTPGVLITAGSLFFGARADRIGASQLDARLLAAPLTALAAAILLYPVLRRSRLATSRGTLGLVVVSLALACISGFSAPTAAAALAQHGAWAKFVITGLRAATDVDRDGYSSWFEGGDCAPWDPRVHPGAPERPGNGTDDNCIGGDAELGPAIQTPLPSELNLTLPDRPNLVLVTVETLRADRVSFLGYGRNTTPRLAELAEESVVFERFYATTPTTRLSLPALFSGIMPSRIAWQLQAPEKRMRRIGPNTPWLPEILQERGYTTIAVLPSFRAFTEVESAGFNRGFEHYDTSVNLVYRGGTLRGFPGGLQVDRAIQLLTQVKGSPFFLWLHLVEPHYLYEQPPEVPRFGDREGDLYDAEIAEADRQIGRLMDALSTRGLFANSVVMVSGDHGEEFGEHGERWHTSNLYEPQVRTAALLRIPGLGQRRISEAASLTDLAPTLLDLLGMPEELRRMQGRNLLFLLEAKARTLEPFFLENFSVGDGRAYQLALISWPKKLVYRQDGGILELYDLAKDPGERKNLYPAEREASADLVELLHRFRENQSMPAVNSRLRD